MYVSGDVDLEHGFVNITHQLQYNNVGKDACQYQILTPKSKSGVRNVPLSNAARDALMEQMKNQIEMDKKTEIEIDGYKDFVFSNRQNKPFITQTIGRILNFVCQAFICNMIIQFHRHFHRSMTHDILQCSWINSGFCHTRA